MMSDRKRQQDPPSELTAAKRMKFVPSENIQFGYHSTAGEKISLNNDGLGAEVYKNGVAFGAHPLKGRAEFEVKIVKIGLRGMQSLWPFGVEFGVIRCKKSASGPIHSIDNDQRVWFCQRQRLYNNLIEDSETSDYGYVDLRYLCEGDRVGVRLSQDGVLEFFVDGESQGIAARDVYTRNSDVYAVFLNCYPEHVTTVITKAGEIATCTHVIAKN